MVYTLHSCILVGLDPQHVLCEVDLARQIPAFTLVGLPSSLTQESRERTRAAVVNAGFEWPARKVTINLLPASLPKWGSHFELAMALGVLGAATQKRGAVSVLAMGELSLSGEVRPCGWLPLIARWVLENAKTLARTAAAEPDLSVRREPLLVIAHAEDIRQLLQTEPALADFCELAPAATLVEAVGHVNRAEESLRWAGTKSATVLPFRAKRAEALAADFATLRAVRDEPLGVVAALAALAGGHHCLFAGPHGMGKSMLIRAITEALPPFSERVLAERAAMFSSFGAGFASLEPVSAKRAVVELQTSVSRAALEGALLSTGQIVPGEFTRAHRGVLVADEFLELRRDVIEAFRQPLDEGIVRLQRARLRTVLPARFQLLASTNLCPCGKFGLNASRCVCVRVRREAYQGKLSGPILDRFDLLVLVGSRDERLEAPPVPPSLQPMVDALANHPEQWANRLAQAPIDGGEEASLSWSEVSSSDSDRGRLKIGQVARTLARLLGEPRTSRHLRLAQLLRADFAGYFACKVQTTIKKPSEYHRLLNI